MRLLATFALVALLAGCQTPKSCSYRSTITGQYVGSAYAVANPDHVRHECY